MSKTFLIAVLTGAAIAAATAPASACQQGCGYRQPVVEPEVVYYKHEVAPLKRPPHYVVEWGPLYDGLAAVSSAARVRAAPQVQAFSGRSWLRRRLFRRPGGEELSVCEPRASPSAGIAGLLLSVRSLSSSFETPRLQPLLRMRSFTSSGRDGLRRCKATAPLHSRHSGS